MEFEARPRLSPVGMVLKGVDEVVAARSSEGIVLEAVTDVSFGRIAVDSGLGTAATEFSSLVNFTIDESSDAFGRTTNKGRTERFNEPLEYGADYDVMTLKLLSRKMRTTTKAAVYNRYLEELFAPSTDAQLLRTTRAESRRSLVQRSKYEAPTGKRSWTLVKSEKELFHLSTFTVQSYMCAALNCRRLLRLVFGVSDDGTVEGITMTMKQRDELRQGIDFAMSREFIPCIDPDIYSVDFVPIKSSIQPSQYAVGELIEDCFVVEIALKRVSSQVYQLSSGRVFFQDVDDSSKVKEADSLMQVRDFIAAKRKAEHEHKLTRLKTQLRLANRSRFTVLLFELFSRVAIQFCANALLF